MKQLNIDVDVNGDKHLKIKCNVFLVVKVNCSSFVFNIIKYIGILRNITK